MRIRDALTVALAAAVHGAPASAAEPAKDYPNRPIRMIVTNAPGSSVDTLSRIVAVKLGEVLGQQVVVDNRPGAGSTLGMEIGKNANPDGYTLVSAPTAAHSLPKRTPLLGDLPAVAETIPGYDYSGWNGLIAPRGTPKPILDKVRAALLKTMSLPEVKDTMAAQATDIATNTPEEFRKLALEELKKYGEVVKAVGLKVE